MFAAFFLLLAAAQGGQWLDVPFVRQSKNGCGSAALSMVLQYWARNGATVAEDLADANAIQRELYSKKAEGIFASDLVRYLENHGFQAFTFKADWTDLQDHLSKGRPLIVSLGHSKVTHYVVVAGLDSGRNLLYLNDPEERKLMLWDRPSFERAWTGHWTLLAVPVEQKKP